MKNIKIGLSLWVIAFILCLFSPCGAFAQDGGVDPCCYGRINQSATTGADIIPWILWFIIAPQSTDSAPVVVPIIPALTTVPAPAEAPEAVAVTMTMPAVEESQRLVFYIRQSRV